MNIQNQLIFGYKNLDHQVMVSVLLICSITNILILSG